MRESLGQVVMSQQGPGAGCLCKQSKKDHAKGDGLDGPPVFQRGWQRQGEGQGDSAAQATPEHDDLVGAVDGFNGGYPV